MPCAIALPCCTACVKSAGVVCATVQLFKLGTGISSLLLLNSLKVYNPSATAVTVWRTPLACNAGANSSLKNEATCVTFAVFRLLTAVCVALTKASILNLSAFPKPSNNTRFALILAILYNHAVRFFSPLKSPKANCA